MGYSEEQKNKIGLEFLEYCEKIGYGKLEVEIIEGIPMHIDAVKQKVHLEKGLTNHPGNTTIE